MKRYAAHDPATGAVWTVEGGEAKAGLTAGVQTAPLPDGFVTGRDLLEFADGRFVFATLTEAERLERERAAALAAIRAVASGMRARVTGTADRFQVDGWGQKALAVTRLLGALDGGVAPLAGDLAILQGECDARGLGETAEQLARAIQAKATRHTRAAAIIDGLQRRYEALAESGTPADITALPDQLRADLAAAIANDPAP